MFIDGNSQERPDKFSGFEQNEKKIKDEKGKYIVYSLYAVLFLFFIVAFYIFFVPKNNKPVPDKPIPVATSTFSGGILPDDPGGENGNGSATSTGQDIRGERIIFGDYYNAPENDFEASLESYSLPIDVKTDVSNYYELSRKVDLSKYLETINNNGFAILDNQFSKEADDFFAMNRLLSSKEIPVVVTSDLVFYYYQNILKEVYKDIQKNSFYKNVWDINKTLYDASLARYRKKRLELGNINDPVLEGERLEVAYFAVALKILVPTDKQINRDESTGLLDFNRFNEQEADFYSFNLPSYLEDDVLKEVEYIRRASDEEKSPVLLYPKDYSNFEVPTDYKGNAKLNNFYLAMKWMNSNFPLNYKTADCPDCLLDKNDWLINFIAANFITKDLFANQEAKNQWAVVYKFISFFSGLRSDLTYLHYNEAMSELFGENYSIEDIFSSENPERDADVEKIKSKISEFSFPEIEGSFKRNNSEERPMIGMRILQEAYWPNDYIFERLVGEDMLAKKQRNFPDRVGTETECPDANKELYRCKTIGLDIANLINPIQLDNEYFARNSDYYLYAERSAELSTMISSFDKYTNNNNVYWMSLDLASDLYVDSEQIAPVFMKNKFWNQERSDNTLMGAWVNLHLPSDVLENYLEQAGGALGSQSVCDRYNYVDPNIKFLSEIIARNDMLIKMLEVLNVAKTANTTTISLKEFNDKIEFLLAIARKELSGEVIDNEDCKFLNSFIKHRVVESAGSKRMMIDSRKMRNQSIEGLKIVTFVYKSDEKLIMAMGPVFNYREYR